MATTVRTLSTFNFSDSLNNQYLYISNSLNGQDTKLRLSDLIRNYRSIGGGISLISKSSNSEVFFKNLKVSGAALTADDSGGGIQIALRESLLDLSKCSNTKSLFLSSVDLTKNVAATVLPTANGGTNKSTAYVIGDVLYASATDTLAGLAGVATGNALISGGVGAAPSWGKIALGTHVSGTLSVANGGTGVATVASRAILCGNGASPMSATSAATAGQILIGSNAGNPAFASLASSDTSIIITGGNNTLDVKARVSKLELSDGTDMLVSTGSTTSTSAGKTFHYSPTIEEINSATKTLADTSSGKIYTLNRAGGIAITLPAAAAGLSYEFHIITTFTGTCSIEAASSADTFTGCVLNMDKDEKGSVVALNEGIDTTAWNIPALADYRLTLDADSDGRFVGGRLKFTALSAAIWHVEGTLFGDGTATHIFS